MIRSSLALGSDRIMRCQGDSWDRPRSKRRTSPSDDVRRRHVLRDRRRRHLGRKTDRILVSGERNANGSVHRSPVSRDTTDHVRGCRHRTAPADVAGPGRPRPRSPHATVRGPRGWGISYPSIPYPPEQVGVDGERRPHLRVTHKLCDGQGGSPATTYADDATPSRRDDSGP